MQSGLNKKEIEIYIRSLKIGPNRSPQLCKYTNISRNMAQYTCQQLVKKRLMTVCPDKNALIFTAEPPEKFLLLLEEDRKIFKNRQHNLKQVVHILENMPKEQQREEQPQVQYFEGAHGIIDMFEDVLREGSTILGATKLSIHSNPIVREYLLDSYLHKRELIGNEARAIFNDNKMSKAYRKEDPRVNRISLLVPMDTFPFESCMHIYGEKTAFYSFQCEKPVGTIINNRSIHNTMESLFSLCWETARKLPVNKRYSDVLL